MRPPGSDGLTTAQRYYRRHTELCRARSKACREKNKERYAEVARSNGARNWIRLKQTVTDAYGGRCYCCGEDDLRFLTIEHLKNDGKQHRATAGGSGLRMYQDLQKRGWPQDEGITVACWTCNMARRFQRECPHKSISVAYGWCV